MKIEKKKLSEIHPYEKNPRKNDKAVESVAESIRQCEYVAPIIVDENGIILAGHTRFKALQKLGWDCAEVVVKEGLSEEQKRKYRLLDNKTSEIAEWDIALLKEELEGLDFGNLDLDWGIQEIEEYDFSDFDELNEKYEGEETDLIKISVPEKYINQVKEWLANGEKENSIGMGIGVMKRCGLL